MKLKKKHQYANKDDHPTTLLYRLNDETKQFVWIGFSTDDDGIEYVGTWSNSGKSSRHSDHDLHRVSTDRPAKEGELCVFLDSGHIANADAVGIMALSGNEVYQFQQVDGAIWKHCAPIKQYIRAVKEQAKCQKT